MIIDTHSHCYWDTLEPRIDEVLENMGKQGVTHAVQIGCEVESSKKSIALAQRFPGVFFATVGHHPETAQDHILGESMQEIEQLEGLIEQHRDIVLAVGECGFDYHYLDGTDGGKIPFDRSHPTEKAKKQIQNQKDWWIYQWELANRYDLPLVIHTRDARDETIQFMKDNAIDRCVMHCFSEDWDFARELLDFSSEIYFSFSGILTYKKSDKIQEAAQKIPLNRILVETDAPFLSPQAVRGTVNEPANTRCTLEKLCELRTEKPLDIERQVYENSKRFYSL